MEGSTAGPPLSSNPRFSVFAQAPRRFVMFCTVVVLFMFLQTVL